MRPEEMSERGNPFSTSRSRPAKSGRRMLTTKEGGHFASQIISEPFLWNRKNFVGFDKKLEVLCRMVNIRHGQDNG
jgi:hypothetical protein